MGFLDKLFKTGMRAAENAINRAVNDAVYETVNDTVDKAVREGIDKTKDALGVPSSATTSVSGRSSSSVNTASATSTVAPVSASTGEEYDDRLFSQKLPEVLAKIGDFEIRENISPDVIEEEAGRELYKRGGCYRIPKDISYGIYKDGQCILYINTWWNYTTYKQVGNRALKNYCDQNGTPMLDFFEYLPNEVDYMEERIRKAIG